MVTKKLYMGEFNGELEIIIRGDDVYLTDMDDDECVHIPRNKLQEVRDSMQSQLQKVPTPRAVHKGSPYRDGDWFESCKPDDHD